MHNKYNSLKLVLKTARATFQKMERKIKDFQVSCPLLETECDE